MPKSKYCNEYQATTCPFPAGRAVMAAAFLMLFLPRPVFAYIDPGAGSAAYQMLLAVVLGTGFVLRRGLSALRSRFFTNRTRIETSSEPGRSAAR